MIDAKEVIKQIIEGIQDKKGKEIVVVDMVKLGNSVCDYFVICQGNSPNQVSAITDSIEDTVRINCKVAKQAQRFYISIVHKAVFKAFGNAFAKERIVYAFLFKEVKFNDNFVLPFYYIHKQFEWLFRGNFRQKPGLIRSLFKAKGAILFSETPYSFML